LARLGFRTARDTILRWCRRLIARKYDSSNAQRPGRPNTKPDIAALVVRMAHENPTWGGRLVAQADEVLRAP
jgi:hypothetical protein